uniref:Syntaxin N-terminal domain-containing protein n=1 Tax=Gossypium raimondii TaxID=29730 RepID=A0A0D2SS19_GOSRA|nr:hypothetical protein B456_010G132600 [Gossypium raimondii]
MQTLRYFIYRKIKPSKDAKSGSLQMLLATSSYSQSQHLEETTNAPVETYRQERINLLVQDFNDVQDQLDVIKEKQKEIALAQRSHGKEIRRC